MDLFIPQASSFAGEIDFVILLVFWIILAWFIATEGIFFWLIAKGRKKAGQRSEYITGKEKHLKRWIGIPHAFILLFDIAIVWAAVQVWHDVKIELPAGESTVRVTGQQWAWVFQHPGPDNVLDTADDIEMLDELHVEVDRTYHFQLESRDVLHNFSVPVFRLKQDAIPGRRITGWFEPTAVGQYDIQCAEICGIGHGVMFGRIFVESSADHTQWMAANAPAGGAGSLALASDETPTAARE
jgi:cytochrome c oxidase subunit 2